MGKDWSESGLSPVLQQIVLETFSFPSMTPVQAASIPLFCQNKDVCVEACTGSGKTLAYLLPIFHRLLLKDTPTQQLYAVIIAPSRELAHQIHSVATKVNAALSVPVSLYCMTGGTSIPEEIKKLESEPIALLIATPGRLWDMLNKVEGWSLKEVEVLVLDEADRLLDMGFQEKVQGIVQMLPKQRRTGLFSATMSTEIKELVKAGLRNPAFISVKTKSKVSNTKEGKEQAAMPRGLQNFYVTSSSSREKIAVLFQFLKENPHAKTIVFFGTCDSTNFFHLVLSRIPGFPQMMRIHGKMPQRKREKVYAAFESAGAGVLLTTDLIARGIDFPDVDWIVQFDPPKSPDSFIHRIGRTARAGKTGQTLILLRSHEEAYIAFLQGRGVVLQTKDIDMKDYSEAIERVVLEDREVYEEAQKAFVSYIRFYQEQELSFLFRLKDLDIGDLAHSYSLLRLPRVTEILGKSIPTFTPSDTDPNDVAFKDPLKEAKRQEELIQKADEKEARRLAKAKAKDLKAHRTRSEKRVSKRSSFAKELDSLRHEENLVKKIKRGQVSSEEAQKFMAEFPNLKAIFRRKKH